MIKVISVEPENPELFDEEIGKQPAFVKIYQPWCGHCQALAPKWKEMGEQLKRKYTGGVSIIEVHGDSLNNIKSDLVKNVDGFPKIFMVKKGGIKGEEYNGDRSTEDMMKFIVKHAELIEKPKNLNVNKNSRSRAKTRTSSHSQRGGRKTRRLGKRRVKRTKRQRRHTRTYSRK